MNNVEKFFKEWGSVCRMLTKKDKAIYSHKELLDFAEQYQQSKVNNVVLDDVIKCPMCGEYGEKGLDNRYYCNNCERYY